jgi:hypothetical protein
MYKVPFDDIVLLIFKEIVKYDVFVHMASIGGISTRKLMIYKRNLTT